MIELKNVTYKVKVDGVDKILIDSLGEVTLILKSGLSIHSRRKENE